MKGRSPRTRAARSRQEKVAKKRVHEIAKAKGLTSKEVLAALKAAGIEAKAAQSNVEESDALAALKGAGGETAPRPPLRPSPRRRSRPPRRSRRIKEGTDGKAASRKSPATTSADGSTASDEAKSASPAKKAPAKRRRRVVIDSQAARRDHIAKTQPPPRPPRRRGGRRRRPLLEEPQDKELKQPEEAPAIKVNSGATVREVAESLGLSAAEVIKALMKEGEMATLTQTLTDESVEAIAKQFDRKLEIVTAAEEEVELPEAEDEEGRPRRPPAGDHGDGPRRSRQDLVARRDPPDPGRGRRGRWDHPAHRRLPGEPRREDDHLPRYPGSRGVHRDARSRRQGHRRRRDRGRRRRWRDAADGRGDRPRSRRRGADPGRGQQGRQGGRRPEPRAWRARRTRSESRGVGWRHRLRRRLREDEGRPRQPPRDDPSGLRPRGARGQPRCAGVGHRGRVAARSGPRARGRAPRSAGNAAGRRRGRRRAANGARSGRCSTTRGSGSRRRPRGSRSRCSASTGSPRRESTSRWSRTSARPARSPRSARPGSRPSSSPAARPARSPWRRSSRRPREGELKELNIVLKADVAGSLEALEDEIAKLPQEQVAGQRHPRPDRRDQRVRRDARLGLGRGDHRLQRPAARRGPPRRRPRGRRHSHLHGDLQGHRGAAGGDGGPARARGGRGGAGSGRGPADVQGLSRRHDRRLRGHRRQGHPRPPTSASSATARSSGAARSARCAASRTTSRRSRRASSAGSCSRASPTSRRATSSSSSTSSRSSRPSSSSRGDGPTAAFIRLAAALGESDPARAGERSSDAT